jgi:hypothetical protein
LTHILLENILGLMVCSETYLIAACGMTGISAMEPIQHVNSTNFVTGITKIQLRFGFCHTIVLNKDSKFFRVFKEAVNLRELWEKYLF